MPPVLVRIPAAAFMPSTSSGLVSLRTKMTLSPASARSTGVFRGERQLADAAPGDAGKPASQNVRRVACGRLEARQQQLRQVVGRNTEHSGLLVDQFLFDHVASDFDRGDARSLAGTRLQHVQSHLVQS